jgi:hypothetical protein
MAGQESSLAAAPFHAKQQWPQHPHALIASRNIVEFVQERVKQHAEGERQHPKKIRV